MKFSNLPNNLQLDIACSSYDIEDNLENLSLKQHQFLNEMSEEDLFVAYCRFHGLYNWGRTLHKVHETIFGGTK